MNTVEKLDSQSDRVKIAMPVELSALNSKVTLIHGDCLLIVDAVLKKHLKVNAADPREWCVVADPPYGIGYVHSGGGKGKHWRTNLKPIHGDDAPFDPSPWLTFKNVVLMGANHFAQFLPHGRWLVWDKLNGLESYDSFSDVEFAWHSSRVGGDRMFRYLWKGICQQGDKEGGKVHPSQKPTPLMAWLMDQAKIPAGATVLDPYMGSGTTAIACIRTGRDFIGIEIDESYFNIAVERCKREIDGQLL